MKKYCSLKNIFSIRKTVLGVASLMISTGLFMTVNSQPTQAATEPIKFVDKNDSIDFANKINKLSGLTAKQKESFVKSWQKYDVTDLNPFILNIAYKWSVEMSKISKKYTDLKYIKNREYYLDKVQFNLDSLLKYANPINNKHKLTSSEKRLVVDNVVADMKSDLDKNFEIAKKENSAAELIEIESEIKKERINLNQKIKEIEAKLALVDKDPSKYPKNEVGRLRAQLHLAKKLGDLKEVNVDSLRSVADNLTAVAATVVPAKEIKPDETPGGSESQVVINVVNNNFEAVNLVASINYVSGYGVLLRDQNGNIPTGRQYLQHGTNWKVNAKKVINGVTYYRLGNDNQWVEAQYLIFKDTTPINPIMKLNTVGKVVYHGKGGVLLLNKDGIIPAKRQYLKNNTNWKVNAKTTVNGRTLYRLGTNDQWIPAQYLRF